MDEVSETERQIWLTGWMAGAAQREMLERLVRLVPLVRCPFGDRCACDPGDPDQLRN